MAYSYSYNDWVFPYMPKMRLCYLAFPYILAGKFYSLNEMLSHTVTKSLLTHITSHPLPNCWQKSVITTSSFFRIHVCAVDILSLLLSRQQSLYPEVKSERKLLLSHQQFSMLFLLLDNSMLSTYDGKKRLSCLVFTVN